MTVTEAKRILTYLEEKGFGEFNIAVNNVTPTRYLLTIGKYTLDELCEIIKEEEQADLQLRR